ncbi:HhH-GPD-type base excision DNA repair protein [Jiangella anatolica]|uniref:Fe-S cluster assembly protein HesB n=1 Tax=Jiangella anatolica TaxID=2670374 RepID=A0A2W2B2V5_9ACTN|nr:HhH-GPD-type base excision DNA repair protein [Jiangella anatolica]PZF79250.1 Fe-S cluster assembly protein HesB [Jiangella anatolica]
MTTLHLAGDPAADALLARDPFSLLTGMLLDQQVPMEKAFSGPAVIAERMGADHLDPAAVAAYDPEAFAEIFSRTPAVHRFPGSMAGRVQKLAAYVAEHYANDAANLWSDAATGAELLKRLKALPGFGEQKAKIMVALLGKQIGVRPDGWREAAGDYGAEGATRSVADVVDADTLLQVRATKREIKRAAKA